LPNIVTLEITMWWSETPRLRTFIGQLL